MDTQADTSTDTQTDRQADSSIPLKTFMLRGYKTLFENIVGKGEYAGNQHFPLFPQCFLAFPKQISISEPYLFCCLHILSIWLIDWKVFNAVSNSISVISQWPVDLSMLLWSSFNQFSAQYSIQATGCFPT